MDGVMASDLIEHLDREEGSPVDHFLMNPARGEKQDGESFSCRSIISHNFIRVNPGLCRRS
jgi:hypothetical protein